MSKEFIPRLDELTTNQETKITKSIKYKILRKAQENKILDFATSNATDLKYLCNADHTLNKKCNNEEPNGWPQSFVIWLAYTS